MARLSRAQEACRRQIQQLLTKSLLPETAGSAILAALQTAIPSDGGALYGVDPSSLLFNRTLAATAVGSEERLYWLKNIYLVREPMPEGTFVAQMRANNTSVVFNDHPQTSWGATPQITSSLSAHEWRRIYHEIGTPGGGILRGCFATNHRWIAAMEVFRLDATRPFRPSDVSFLRPLATSIGAILGSAFERERAWSELGADPDSSGVLLLGPDDRVRLCTPAAEAWIGLLRDMERSHGAALPTAVLSVIAGLRAGPERYPGHAALIRTPVGQLRIEASIGGEDGTLAIVLAPRPPSTPSPIPPQWPLTPQERRIVSLLANGSSNRQISAVLFVSENTVESHLTHIYDKLGTRGRVELLARLFREVYLEETATDPHNGSPE